MGKNRKHYSDTFKQKVVREAFTREADAKDIAAKYEIAPSTPSEWKTEALSGKDSKRVRELEKKLAEMEAERETMLTALCKKDLIIELLKKECSPGRREDLISLVEAGKSGEHGSMLSVSEQCRLLGIPRSTFYEKRHAPAIVEDDGQSDAARLERGMTVFNEWLSHPTYGYLKMSRHLRKELNDWATERVVRRYYMDLGIHGEKPMFRTTRASCKPYARFPYLLRNRKIQYCNEVWATDITYIRLLGGMVYFTAVIDLKIRKILTWRLSKDMKVGFCLDCAYEAFETYGVPAIFNTDCGSQYISREFIELLQSYGIRISMDGVGRCRDNIYVERTWRTLKYEWVFLRDYRTYEEREAGLGEFVELFNNERLH